jgi:hypothetical protein
MTGFLMIAVMVALLMWALEPAHRRARRRHPAPLPGADLSDRDRQRVITDLRMLGGR